jgi:hypothetical protein
MCTCCRPKAYDAAGSPFALDGSKYGDRFAAMVLADKLATTFPLKRQAKRFAREGLAVSASGLCWIV